MRMIWGLCALLALVAGSISPDQVPPWMREAIKDANGDRMKMSGEQYSPYSAQAGSRLPG